MKPWMYALSFFAIGSGVSSAFYSYMYNRQHENFLAEREVTSECLTSFREHFREAHPVAWAAMEKARIDAHLPERTAAATN